MKKCTFGKEWRMGSEMRISVFFFIKNRFFQSYWNFQQLFPIVFGTALGSCFSLWMILNLPSSSLKKIDFLIRKNVHSHFWTHKPSLTKNAFFSSKKGFFFKDGEGRLKIIQRLKQDLKAGPNTIGYMSSKFQEFLKNRFFDEKNAHFHFWPHKPFLTKCAFFHQKINFFQRRWE